MADREPYLFSDWKAGRLPPVGWDCADAIDDGWTRDDLEAFMRATVRPWSAPTPPDAPEPVAPLPAPTPSPSPPPPPPAAPATEARTVVQELPDDGPASNVVDMRTRLKVVGEVDWRGRLQHTEEGGLRATKQINWALYMLNHEDMEGVFAFNAFKRVTMVMKSPPWHTYKEFKPRVVKDTDFAEAAMWLEECGMSPAASKVSPIVQAIAERNSFDPLDDYLAGLEWDRKPRVDTWLTYYLGVMDTPYARAVARKALVASVARAMMPGCKCDTMMILEGDQGIQKSGAFRALYSEEFFTDELSDLGSKDASMELQGVWCVEVAEMQRFTASDANEVKKFLSRQIDRYRPPYGRSVIEAPRRSILAGTINPDGNPYLKDPTGARRFWPVTCGPRIDVEGISEDRDHLWAEALHMLRNGENWWMTDEALQDAKSEQAKRTDVDVWADVLAGAVMGRSTFSVKEALEALDISTKSADQRHSQRIGRVMAYLGWVIERVDGRVMFKKPGAKVTMADDPKEW